MSSRLALVASQVSVWPGLHEPTSQNTNNKTFVRGTDDLKDSNNTSWP